MADPLWLAEVLRAEGLNVIEHDGWRNRGHGDFRDIRGVLCHHTAGGGENDWKIVQNGRPDLPGPLAQLVLERNGAYRVIAAGVCWHAGRGRWTGWPTDNANWHVIGIEAVNNGTGQEWPAVQLDAYKRGCAAILRRLGRNANDCVGHKEYSSEGKIDPFNINMNDFRRDVQAVIDGGGEELDVSAVEHIENFIKGYVGPGLSDIKDVREQLCGAGQRDAGQYGGWPQLGDEETAARTVVDGQAVMLELLYSIEKRLAALEAKEH